MGIISQFFEGYEACQKNCQECCLSFCWRAIYPDFKEEVLNVCPPVELGDHVWVILPPRQNRPKIVECTVQRIQNGVGKTMITLRSAHTIDYRHYSHAYSLSSFGKTIFRTKEEAERNLYE